MDIVDHPLFWDGPNVLHPDVTILIDDKGFGHVIDSKIDANLTRPIHSVRKSLTELTDKPPVRQLRDLRRAERAGADLVDGRLQRGRTPPPF